jgi:hypothetical protein
VLISIDPINIAITAHEELLNSMRNIATLWASYDVMESSLGTAKGSSSQAATAQMSLEGLRSAKVEMQLLSFPEVFGSA